MQMEIVRFPNGSIKDPKNFIKIIHCAMEKLQDIAIAEYVQKVPDRMEAKRYVSYPYDAWKESLVNAFYHKDYMCYETVYVEIQLECIRIIRYPGIDRYAESFFETDQDHRTVCVTIPQFSWIIK